MESYTNPSFFAPYSSATSYSTSSWSLSNPMNFKVHGIDQFHDDDDENYKANMLVGSSTMLHALEGKIDRSIGFESNKVTKFGNESRNGEKKKEAKGPKYAFETRSQVDILDDGYRWRKYGQKAVKNNKFPRSYYRCTYQGCNVKKQIQRLTADEGVVVTTYEGTHTHSIQKPTDNFEYILTEMQIYGS